MTRLHQMLLLLCIGLSVVALGLLAFRTHDAVTLENYERITSDMSDADVADLLGSPGEEVAIGKAAHARRWVGRDALLVVFFDASGRVQDKVYNRYGDEPILPPPDYALPK